MSSRRWRHYQFGNEIVLKCKCADFVRWRYFMKEEVGIQDSVSFHSYSPLLDPNPDVFYQFWHSGAYAVETRCLCSAPSQALEMGNWRILLIWPLWRSCLVIYLTEAARKTIKPLSQLGWLCNTVSFHVLKVNICRDFPGGAVVKNPPDNAGDTGLSPGLGRSHMPWSN